MAQDPRKRARYDALRDEGRSHEDAVASVEREFVNQPAPVSPGARFADPNTPAMTNTGEAIRPAAPRQQSFGEKALGTVGSGVQGLTAGFSDEISGLTAAAIPGGKGYAEARDAERKRLASFRESNPKLALSGEVVGSLLTAGAGGGAAALRTGVQAAKGASTAAQALKTAARVTLPQLAVQGGKQGLVYGAGTAEGGTGRQIGQTIFGGVAGATGGFLIPGTARVGGKVVGAAARKLSGRGPRTMETEAGERVLTSVLRDDRTPAELMANMAKIPRNQADDLVLADLADGPNTRGLLDQMAISPGRAANQVEELIDARAGALRPKLVQALEDLTQKPTKSPEMFTNALKETRRVAGHEMYEPVFAAVPGAVDDEAVLLAVNNAAKVPGIGNAAKKLAAAWKIPVEALVESSADGATAPTYRFAHYIKQALDAGAERATAQGDNALAAGLGKQAQELDEALSAAMPGYRRASETFAGFSRQLDAANAGSKLLSQAVDVPALQAEVAALAPAELEAFRMSGQAALKKFLLSRKANLTGDATTAWWTNADMQAKVRLLFDDPKEFEKFFDAVTLARTKAKTNLAGRGSETARRLAHDEDMGISVGDVAQALTSPKQTVLTFGQRVGSMLGRRNKEQVNEAVLPFMTAQGRELEKKLPELHRLMRDLEQRGRKSRAGAGISGQVGALLARP